MFENLFKKEDEIDPTKIEVGGSVLMSVEEVSAKMLAESISPKDIVDFRNGGPNPLFYTGSLSAQASADEFFKRVEEEFPEAWKGARAQERDTRAFAEDAIRQAVAAVQTYFKARDGAIVTQQAANKLGLAEEKIPTYDDNDHQVPKSLRLSLRKLAEMQEIP